MVALTDSQIALYVDQGRGQGRGPDYLSWLRPRSFSSRGYTCRPQCRLYDRLPFVTFSLHESNFALMVQSVPGVTELREQVPLLPLSETQDIAAELGVQHPQESGVPVVMTVDFIVTMNGEELAVSVKESKEIHLERVLVKHQIAKVWCERRGMRLVFVTEKEMPEDLCWNLRWMNDRHELDWKVVPRARLPQLLVAVFAAFADDGSLTPANQVCLDLDNQLGLEAGSSLNIARYGLQHDYWTTRLDIKLDPSRPMPPLRLTQRAANLGEAP